jgi:CRISPR/Cas system CMR subunit Cmr4 (Cas7 group RAMP superfamily)
MKIANVETVVETKPSIEPAYMQLIKADQDQNRERATNLPILNEEAKKNIAEASKYSGYFANPITTPFMKKYILSKLEFPTVLSCLAQSITELNVRTENLYNDAYMYEKAKLEAEEFEVKADEAEDNLHKAISDIERRKAEVEFKKARLEAANKKVSLRKIELQAMARYKEAMGWKQCVEDYMEEGGYTSLEEVPWDDVRMGEMAAKIKKWGELQAQGALEMTPSKFNVIHDNIETFAEGAKEMQAKIAQAEQQRLLSK